MVSTASSLKTYIFPILVIGFSTHLTIVPSCNSNANSRPRRSKMLDQCISCPRHRRRNRFIQEAHTLQATSGIRLPTMMNLDTSSELRGCKTSVPCAKSRMSNFRNFLWMSNTARLVASFFNSTIMYSRRRTQESSLTHTSLSLKPYVAFPTRRCATFPCLTLLNWRL